MLTKNSIIGYINGKDGFIYIETVLRDNEDKIFLSFTKNRNDAYEFTSIFELDLVRAASGLDRSLMIA